MFGCGCINITVYQQYYYPQMHNSHSQISVALDHILTKCGQTLYQAYLNEKLPTNCNEKVSGSIEHGFDAMVRKQPVRSKIARESMPRPASVDVIMPMKMPVRSRDEYESKKLGTCRLFATQLLQQDPTSSTIKSSKPNFCIKYSCAKGGTDIDQQKIRIKKLQSDRQQLQSATQSHRSERNVNARRKNLEAKIKQLMGEGIPCAFDDEGNLIAPDIKDYKKELQIQSKREHQAKPFTLRYKAIEMISGESQIQGHSKLLGRKKGYSSIKSERKKKINDEEFNNKHQRQCSAIPFMNVQLGVKIVEKDRNIMAERLREPHLSRQQFMTQSKKSLFKSYLPLSEYNSTGRPATHCHNRNSRSVGLSSATSLHARPKTSRESRININNKELAIEMVRDDSTIFRKFI